MMSTVAFPGSEPTTKQISQPRGPHLPFRRISLPTAPTMIHRHSVISVVSVDSLPEEGQPSRSPVGRKTRPMSIESPRRRNRRRDSSVKPAINDVARAVKRRKIIDELYETEKAYVEGLNLIYSHFLVPIIESLDTPEPILNRATLTATFSNFIDIWNFHRSFFAALDKSRESIGPLLLSHFPYLSLYNPFITQFSSTISSLTDLVTVPTLARPNPLYNAAFAAFLQDKEASPQCGKLKLRDWLLTIVQRCPRYLLLLKDLINHTSPEDPEHAQLTEAHGLVSKITLALNASLHTHAQTLALLALQRSTSGLPFQLISPGRRLVKRGQLLQAERNDPPRPREFLLFSDCLIWLASTDMSGNSWDWDWGMGGWSSGSGSTSTNTSNGVASSFLRPTPPPLVRTRSKSEAELVRLGSDGRTNSTDSASPSATPISQLSRVMLQRRSQHYGTPPPLPPAPPMAKRRSVGSTDEKWTFKGRADLVDLEVTVGSVLGEERRFEILSPEGSFVLYSASDQEREDWVTSIRQAKAHLMISLNATNPNSTLTSSASTNHIRKSLQALPFHPSDDRLAALSNNDAPTDNSNDSYASQIHKILTPISPKKSSYKKDKKEKVEIRRKVDHWVPPIWIPDGRTNECMRCGKLFGWRRRRHHCRLCGRCVCAACSGRTFFIADATGKAESTKPARACDACYETVFPIVEDPSIDIAIPSSSTGADGNPRPGADTISSLANFPAWISMPSIPTAQQSTPQALMAIDINYNPEAFLDNQDTQGGYFPHAKENAPKGEDNNGNENRGDFENHAQLRERGGVLRFKPHQKLKSYHQILQEFEAHEEDESPVFTMEEEEEQVRRMRPSPLALDHLRDDKALGIDEDLRLLGLEEHDGQQDYHPHLFFTPPGSQAPSPLSSPRKRKEDTARRSKRYSQPALALQTTPVTARSSMVIEDDGEGPMKEDGDENGSTGGTPNKPARYSLVLSPGRNVRESVREEDESGAGPGAAKSLAVNKLNQLLSRQSRDHTS